MPLTKFTYFMLGVTVIYLFLHLFGLGVLEILIILFIIDLVLIEINRHVDRFKIFEFKKDNPGNPENKEDMNYVLDKFARKNLELEGKLNKMGRTLAASVASLDERVNNLEEKEE
ncbi:MAG: hypothetical protein ACXACX_20110 [Candidatus Hodarchaeales archaeon]|jgi:hypothetical protein